MWFAVELKTQLPHYSRRGLFSNGKIKRLIPFPKSGIT
jgi:hypothetical protein